MKKYIFCCLVLFSFFSLLAQNVGVNTSNPDPSAALDISSTNSGLLVPRMNTGQRTTIASPANGLMVFDTDTKSYWFRESTNWVELASSIGLKSINGNATFTPYAINPKRYMWELTGSYLTGNSIALPQSIIEDLCADEDGCKVTLTMTNWSAGFTESASLSGTFFYTIAGSNRRWRASNDNAGIDGDNAVNHIFSLFSNFYFTDATYAVNVGTDPAVGLHFMKWNAYPVSAIGRLIIED